MKLYVVLVLLFLTGCGAAKDESPVLARVGSDTITKSEFVERVSGMPEPLQKMALERKKEFVQEMAEELFLLKEAEKRGLEKDPDVQNLLKAARQKILTAKLIEIEIDRKIDLKEQDLVDYYEAHSEELMTPLRLRASHILVKTEDEAINLKSELDTGSDFAELARKHSTDQTAERGGDLGYFQKGQFIPEFETQVLTMKIGELKGPFQSSFGYHVVKLTDRVESRLRDFKSVRTAVGQRLLAEHKQKALKELIEKLKQNTNVEIDEKFLDTISEMDFKEVQAETA